MKKCRICNRILSDVEVEYYEFYCEDCERILTNYLSNDKKYRWWKCCVVAYWKRVESIMRKVLEKALGKERMR